LAGLGGTWRSAKGRPGAGHRLRKKTVCWSGAIQASTRGKGGELGEAKACSERGKWAQRWGGAGNL